MIGYSSVVLLEPRLELISVLIDQTKQVAQSHRGSNLCARYASLPRSDVNRLST